MNRATFAASIDAWHHEGRRIALVSGAFRVLHPGHLHVLERARTEADVVVVAVVGESSASESALIPVHERTEILEALATVDAAVQVDRAEVPAFVRDLRPTVLVDSSHTPAPPALHALVREVGGDVVRAGHVTGWSASGILSAIRGR